MRRMERRSASGRRESAVARERSVGRSSVKGIAVELGVGSAIVATGCGIRAENRQIFSISPSGSWLEIRSRRELWCLGGG